MRFLAVQEDGYGVGVAQDRLPNDADESMMAATGDTSPDELPKVEEGSMISNLPLLFAEGYPTSLDKVTLKQLERFITFMVQCSLGHDTAEVISEPQWWPKEVKFSNPLVRPKKSNESWMANLKKLVFRCYTYHRSDYLLRFCSYLAQYPRDKLYYVNNWDSTTSLYHKTSGKLLVTFRNENMNYDKVIESPRRSLLPQHGATSNFANKSKQPQQQQQTHSLVVIQPPSDEIYLCDNCDAEFVGLEKMKDHEKTCGENLPTNSASRPQTPYEPPIESELAQNQFLEYFSLYSEDNPPAKPSAKTVAVTCNPGIVTANRASRRVRNSVNLGRCPSIPFSSPAGLAMAKKSKMMTENTQQERLDRIERHLHAPALSKSARPKWLDRVIEYNRWVVTYKPNRDRPLTEDQQQQHQQQEHQQQQQQQQHGYEYKFNSRRGKPVLSLRSQLLYVACRPIYVVVSRLCPEAIAELQRDPSKYKPPVRRIIPRIRPRPLSKVRQARNSNFSLKRKLSADRRDDNCTKVVEVTIEKVPANHPVVCPSQFMAVDDLVEITVIKETSRQSPTKTTTPWSEPPKKILFVDLCSSDEEGESAPKSADENRDPMRTTESPNNNRTTSFMKNLALNKFRSKTCVYPADSTSDWLRDNVLTDDNDKCGSKCLGSVVLESCTPFSPILKPAP